MSIFHEINLDDILLSYLTNHKYGLAQTNRYYRYKIFGYLKAIVPVPNCNNLNKYYHDVDIIRYWLYSRTNHSREIIILCADLATTCYKNGIKIAKLYNIVIKHNTLYNRFLTFLDAIGYTSFTKINIYDRIFDILDSLYKTPMAYNYDVLDTFFNCAEVTHLSVTRFKCRNDFNKSFIIWILICRNGRYDLLKHFVIQEVTPQYDRILFSMYAFDILLHKFLLVGVFDKMIQTVKQRNHTEILNYLKDLFKNTDYIIN